MGITWRIARVGFRKLQFGWHMGYVWYRNWGMEKAKWDVLFYNGKRLICMFRIHQ